MLMLNKSHSDKKTVCGEVVVAQAGGGLGE